MVDPLKGLDSLKKLPTASSHAVEFRESFPLLEHESDVTWFDPETGARHAQAADSAPILSVSAPQ